MCRTEEGIQATPGKVVSSQQNRARIAQQLDGSIAKETARNWSVVIQPINTVVKANKSRTVTYTQSKQQEPTGVVLYRKAMRTTPAKVASSQRHESGCH